jgi:hypothetical protein
VAADFAVATSAELQQSPQMCTASFLTKREPSDSKECQVGLWGLHTNSKHMHDVCILAAQCIVLAAIMWRTGCHLGEFALLHGRRLRVKGAVGLCGRFCLGCALTLLLALCLLLFELPRDEAARHQGLQQWRRAAWASKHSYNPSNTFTLRLLKWSSAQVTTCYHTLSALA